MTSSSKRLLAILSAFTIAALYGHGISTAMRHSLMSGANDFAALYNGAQQAASGRLYDFAPQYEAQQMQFGYFMPAVVFTRLPFYAVLLKPLTWLDYVSAWRLFLLLNILCTVWFFGKWLWNDALALLLGASFLPIYAALANGQDVWLAASLFALAMLLERRGRDFSAGAVLSLCAIKPHLFVLVPLVVAVQRRWRFFAGAAAGGTLLMVVSFLAEGTGWVVEYIHTLGDPRIHPNLGVMPTLRNLVAMAGGPPWLYWALCVLTAIAVAVVAFRSARLETGLAAALAGGLAANYHTYLPDTVLLLPAFALLRAVRLSGWPLWPWVLLLSPMGWLLYLAGPPWRALFILAVLCALAGLMFIPTGATGSEKAPGGGTV